MSHANDGLGLALLTSEVCQFPAGRENEQGPGSRELGLPPSSLLYIHFHHFYGYMNYEIDLQSSTIARIY